VKRTVCNVIVDGCVTMVEQSFLKQLQAKNRFIRVQNYQPWMSERTHRKLL
jgi:hypothetical protein